MATKKVQSKETKVSKRTGFTFRPDDIRARQLDDLMKKKGVGQQGIVSIAISEMHERNFGVSKMP